MNPVVDKVLNLLASKADGWESVRRIDLGDSWQIRSIEALRMGGVEAHKNGYVTVDGVLQDIGLFDMRKVAAAVRHRIQQMALAKLSKIQGTPPVCYSLKARQPSPWVFVLLFLAIVALSAGCNLLSYWLSGGAL